MVVFGVLIKRGRCYQASLQVSKPLQTSFVSMVTVLSPLLLHYQRTLGSGSSSMPNHYSPSADSQSIQKPLSHLSPGALVHHYLQTPLVQSSHMHF